MTQENEYIVDEISVIIPAYNDEEVIEQSVREIHGKLLKIARRFEIVLIDDYSVDNTKSIIEKLSSEFQEITPIYHERNTGVGQGFKDGFKIAKYDLVLTNCSDLPFDVADLKEAIPFMKKEDADVCVMVRFDRSANTWFRKLTSSVNCLIIKMLYRTPIEDYNFVQMYKKKVVQSIPLYAKDVFVPPELIIKSYDLGYKVVQFRAVFHRRRAGKSKYGHIKHFVRTFRDQIKFWYLLRIKKVHLI